MTIPQELPIAPKAFSYIRFSTPQQAKGDSFRRQTEKGEKYAADHGLELDTELKLTDRGMSAFQGKNAKVGALGVFLLAVQDGRVPSGSYLLIENMDRLTRNDISAATGLFLSIIDAGIVVVTLTNGEAYSEARLREEPEAMYYIVSELIRANRESARKSQLVGDARARKRERLTQGVALTKPYTKQMPAWVRWDVESKAYQLIPERAAVVRWMFERGDEGWGIMRIASDLNVRRVNTWGTGARKGAFWRASYVSKIFAGRAAIGTFIPHRTTREKDTGRRVDVPMDPSLTYGPLPLTTRPTGECHASGREVPREDGMLTLSANLWSRGSLNV